MNINLIDIIKAIEELPEPTLVEADTGQNNARTILDLKRIARRFDNKPSGVKFKSVEEMTAHYGNKH